MTRLFLAALMATTILTGPAGAATIDAAGAETVKKMVTEMIETERQKMTQENNFNLTLNGTVTVEPKGTYYAVTTPGVQIKIQKGKEGMLVSHGASVINVVPGNTPTTWKMAFNFPSPITVTALGSANTCPPTEPTCKNPTPKEEKFFTIETKTQRLAMVYDSTNKMYSKILGELGPIIGKEASDRQAFIIQKLILNGDRQEITPRVFSGNNTITISNLEITPPKGKITTENVTAKTKFDRFDAAMAETYHQKLAELADGGISKPEDIQTAAGMNAMWKIFMDYGLKQMDGGSFDLQATNIVMIDPKADGDRIMQTHRLKSFGVTSSANGYQSDKSQSDIAFSFAGLALDAPPTSSALDRLMIGYLPQDFRFQFALKDLPHLELAKNLGGLAQTAIGMQEQQKAPCPDGTKGGCPNNMMPQLQMLGMQAMMTLPAVLAQAGTSLTMMVNTTAPQSQINVDGKFTAAPGAVFGGTGQLKGSISGLDQLMTDLTAYTKTPNLKPDDVKKAQKYLSDLSQLQNQGIRGNDAAGKPARLYEFSVDEKGTILVNGKPPVTPNAAGTPAVNAASTAP